MPEVILSGPVSPKKEAGVLQSKTSVGGKEKMMSFLTREETIKRIRAGLRARTGRDWSVSGGRGTAYGWITVEAPPRRQTDWEGRPLPGGGCTSPAERAELARALGLESVHPQGVSVPSGSDYYQEYIDRAEGRTPTVFGQRYWD
jgi:hypothetical protein